MYICAFDTGTLPSSGTKLLYVTGSGNVEKIIDFGGFGATYSLPNFYPVSSYNSFSQHDIKVSMGLSSNTSIAVCIGVGRDFSSYNATLWVKYTKTTD